MVYIEQPTQECFRKAFRKCSCRSIDVIALEQIAALEKDLRVLLLLFLTPFSNIPGIGLKKEKLF